MKKLLALLLAAVMCLSLVACGNTQQANEQTNSSEETTNSIKTKDELLKEAKAVKADELCDIIDIKTVTMHLQSNIKP